MSEVFIGFRASDWELLEEFLTAVRELEVDKTELAKRAIGIGLKAAISEIAREQEERAKRTKRISELLKKGKSPSFESPLAPFTNNAVAALC